MARGGPTGVVLELDPARLIYLDNAATSFPKPPEVYEFMDRFCRSHGVSPGRSGYDLGVEAGYLVDETRRLLAGLFGGTDPRRLVFGQNATDALNLTLFGLLRPGDHAVTTKLDHNSVLRPLWHLGQQGVEVDRVGFDRHGHVDPDEVIRRFKASTRAVVLNHGSNVIGTVQDVAAIGRACRQRGVHLVLDASQTAGAIPVDLDQLGADVICFTGHKSLLGPMGIGGMYVREGVDLRQTRAGGTGVFSIEQHHPADYPFRMEYGTPNLPGIAGLNAGVKWLLGRGMARLHHRELQLWTRLRDGLGGIDGVTMYCAENEEDRLGVLAFNVDGVPASQVGAVLDVDHDIAARTGLHCAPLVHEALGTLALDGAVRFSLGPFTTEADVQTAIAAVQEIADRQRGKG